jgi:light-regulated signal transduction histidine kinase (bacteriophytochrome)
MDRRDTSVAGGRINYDAEFCGKVPLHQTNLVQPHGVLLVVKSDDLTILQGSENAAEVLGDNADKVVGRSLAEMLTPAEVASLRQRLQGDLEGKIPVTLTLAGKSRLALVQKQGAYFLAEVEKEEYAAADSFVEVYQELKFAISTIESADGTEEACSVAAREIRRLSGFDKVMIYRFDKEWNGEVLAEEMSEGMDSYLGLKFPASDVPKPARDLYQRTPYRLIPNINYDPIKLHPVINPLTGAFTDLTDSNLRSVVPVHIEYLRNMKVSASMSTRILCDGKLWGLIACHHREPKYLSYQECSVFELLSHVISARISALTNAETHNHKTGMQQQLTRVMESVYRGGSLLQGLKTQEDALLRMLGAGGMAFTFDRQVELLGQTPNAGAVRDLIYWLQTHSVHKTFQETSLSAAYEDAEAYVEVASGLLALPVQPDKGEYILVFRPEVIRTTDWGGNPNEAVQFEADSKNYHPRNSFRLWQETVRKTAIPWSHAEMEVAENFRALVIEYTLNRM